MKTRDILSNNIGAKIFLVFINILTLFTFDYIYTQHLENNIETIGIIYTAFVLLTGNIFLTGIVILSIFDRKKSAEE